MASRNVGPEMDYNFYDKIMEKLFPTYEYNPHLLKKPSTEFVLDIMELTINYFDDLAKDIPTLKDNDNQDNEQPKESESKKLRLEVLLKCDEIFRRFNVQTDRSNGFTLGDIVNPNNLTTSKIMIMLQICLHASNLDFTESFSTLEQILTEQSSIRDLDSLRKKQNDLEVTAVCLKHKLDKLKSEEEMERLYNAEVVKVEARENQLKKDFEKAQSTLIQRKREHKKILNSIKNVEAKLVEDNVVEKLKLDINALNLKNKSQTIEGENLISKMNTTRQSKELLEFQLNKLADGEAILKQQQKYKISEDELTEKLKNNRRVNADLIKQVDDCKKEIHLINDSNMKMDNWKGTFQMNKAKIEADISAENKKHVELKADIEESTKDIDNLLIDIQTKYNDCENITSKIKALDDEVRATLIEWSTKTLNTCRY